MRVGGSMWLGVLGNEGIGGHEGTFSEARAEL